MDKQGISIKITDSLVTDYTANLMCRWHELNTFSNPGGAQDPGYLIWMLWAHPFTLHLCFSFTDRLRLCYLSPSSLAGLGLILSCKGKNEISKTFAGQENHFLPSSISASKILFGGSFNELILPLCAIWSTVVF